MYDLATLESSKEHGIADTVFAGKLHYSAVTGSTNSDALSAARGGAPNGSVFITDEQTAGRGRGDHGWHSGSGEGLYVSVLLRPQFAPAQLPLVPLAAGLAAANAIRSVASLTVDLRWPNDLLIGPRKSGGILVEAHSEGNVVSFAVVGIGINVHQQSFPPMLSTPATSLDLEAGRRISRQRLLVSLLKSLEKEALALADKRAADEVLTRIAQASTWIRGRHVEVHGPQACEGVTEGLDEHGFLLVRTSTGIVTVQTGGIRQKL